MYRPLAIILTAGILAITGETGYIMINVVGANSSQEALLASSTLPPTIADSLSTGLLTAANHHASTSGSTPSVRPTLSSVPSTAPYASTAVLTSKNQLRLSRNMQGESSGQSAFAQHPLASVGSTSAAFSVAPSETVNAVTSLPTPEVTAITLDPSAPGNSLTSAGGKQVSVDGVANSSVGTDISLAVTSASRDIASLQEDTPAITHDQELFRAKWGWSAYDQALRVSKGFDQ